MAQRHATNAPMPPPRESDLGPQTRHGFGRALEKAGPDGFAHKLALGQFRDYATRLDNAVERYEGLKRDA
jgi:hypothetical protein